MFSLLCQFRHYQTTYVHYCWSTHCSWSICLSVMYVLPDLDLSFTVTDFVNFTSITECLIQWILVAKLQNKHLRLNLGDDDTASLYKSNYIGHRIGQYFLWRSCTSNHNASDFYPKIKT